MSNAPTMLTAAGRHEHVRRNCPCCGDYGSTKNGARNRKQARRRQRRREARTWKMEMNR